MTALRRAPLAAIALVAWLGALVLIHAPEAAGPTAVVGWVGVAIGCVTAAAARRGVLVVLAMAALAVLATHVAGAQPARVDLQSVVSGSITLTGTVATKVERSGGGGVRFGLDVAQIRNADHVTTTAGTTVRVIADADIPAPVDLGAQVTVTGGARPAETGEAAVLVVFAHEVVLERPPAGPWAAAAALRNGFIDTAAGLPDPGGGLLPGLAVGDTRAVSEQLDAAMKQTSLSHLTAVSGANCAIVTGLGFAAAAMCGARRGVRVAIAAAALTGFVLLVTPEPSVVRAATMAIAVLVALALGRPAAGLSALAVAVCVILAFDPWMARSLGFALSAVATASLLLVAPGLARGLSRIMPRAVAVAVSVPVAAQVACGPLLLLVEPTVPVYGVVANMVAGPAAPAATVIGLAACIAAPVPLIADGLAGLAWLPSSWIAHTALVMAEWPGGSAPWPEGVLGIVTLTALGAAVVVSLAGRGKRRVIAGALVVATALGAVGTGVLVPRLALLGAPPAWTVAACEVGQGDAVLVRTGDAVALIDTGPDPAPLASCLGRLGITRLDLLVLTHFDADHVGGIDAVRGSVDTVLHGPAAVAEDRALLASLAQAGAELQEARLGRTGVLGSAPWRVLWPRAADPVFGEGNDASVVLHVATAEVGDLVLLGDLSARAQRALAATGGVSAAEIVKVAHHGSGDQDPALYATLSPRVALVTVGENDYGHPRQEILEVLEGVGAAVARTDTQGLILLAGSGDRIEIWRERSAGRVPGAG